MLGIKALLTTIARLGDSSDTSDKEQVFKGDLNSQAREVSSSSLYTPDETITLTIGEVTTGLNLVDQINHTANSSALSVYSINDILFDDIPPSLVAEHHSNDGFCVVQGTVRQC